MDLHTLTAEELDQARRDVLTEQERRQRLEDAPKQVADLAARFTADGGDPAALHSAIERTEP